MMAKYFKILLFFLSTSPLFGQVEFYGGVGSGFGSAQITYCSSNAFKTSGVGSGFAFNGVYYCADGARYTGSGIGNGDVSNAVFYCDSANQRYLFHEDSTAAGGFAYASQNYCTNITFIGSQSSGHASNFVVCQNPLPIELLSFNAVRSDNVALLLWETGTEINNSFFQIERSTDGFDFFPIGIIPGAGNSNNPIQYSFIDSTPVKGINYYRLQQFDFDGASALSDVRVLDFSGSLLGNLIMYPNPLAADAELNIYFPEKGMLQLEVFDINGRMVFNWSGGDFESNEIVNVGQLNLEQGLYVVRVYSSNSVFSGRLIAQ